VAVTATLALPVVLPLLAAQGLAGRRLTPAIAALIEAVYAQERLETGDVSPSAIAVDRVLTRS
jgi:hypothetical protein